MKRTTLFAAAALFAAPAGPAMAQSTAAPKPAVPAPQVDPGIQAAPSPGVIRPPSTDPGMAVPPQRDGTASVIPPPGTPGNNPTLIPK